MLRTAFASIEHKRLKEGRESGGDDERCGRSKEVNTPQLIGQRVRVRVTMLRFEVSSGRYSVGKGQHSSNRVSDISSGTIHQSTIRSLSQTIWPRWASKQFLSLPIVQTLLHVTFGYSRGCCYETIEEMKEAVTKVIDTLTEEDFYRAFQKLLEWYKCIAAGGDYFEGD